MKTTLRAYDPSCDYMRIRQFLIDTFTLYQRPFNWLIDRWNFCRYHVLPLHTYYNVQYFGVPSRPHHPHRDEVTVWEQSIGIWENDQGEIVAVAHSENEEAGEAWVQIHPNYTFLYDEIVTYVEENLANIVDGLGYVKLYINEGCELEGVATARGYRQLRNWRTPHHEIAVTEYPAPQLPEGFVVKSVLEEDDPDKRRRAKALAFGGNYNPSDWPPASAFIEMQKAPDYHKDLDLFIVGPQGDYVAFCTIWVDDKNRYANFEPVGTHIEYQGQGLGRAILTEGFRRMAQRGITRSFMDSSNDFYRKVGFKDMGHGYAPWIKYFDATKPTQISTSLLSRPSL